MRATNVPLSMLVHEQCIRRKTTDIDAVEEHSQWPTLSFSSDTVQGDKLIHVVNSTFRLVVVKEQLRFSFLSNGFAVMHGVPLKTPSNCRTTIFKTYTKESGSNFKIFISLSF